MPESDPSVLVVGGGIGGLTLAQTLLDADVNVLLVDAGERPGGVIRTRREEGWLLEPGPNTILAGDPAVNALVDRIGLAGQVMIAGANGGRRFLVRRGSLHALPTTPLDFLGSSLLSPGGRLRAMREPLVPRGHDPEESIADFTRRRFGAELLERAIAPFVSGIWAGDPERLVLRHALPKLKSLEAEHGSIIRGFMAAKKKKDAGGATPAAPRGFLTFRTGLSVLPERLAETLGDRYRPRTTVTAVGRAGDEARWEVRTQVADGSTQTIRADRLVLAIDGATTARLLNPSGIGASADIDLLAQTPTAPVAVTFLGFRREDVDHPLDGFGFLAPRSERLRLLGAIFSSSLFAGRAPDGHHLLTVLAGGAFDPGFVALGDEEIVASHRKELTPLLGLRGTPVMTRTERWPAAIPQYDRSHTGRLAAAGRIEESAAARIGRDRSLTLLGNWRGGVSVADRIARGSEAGRDLAKPR